jgi:hypothetical protein
VTVHVLKTLPPYFDAIERGEKTFEIRRDDRGFQKGDVLHLQEYNPKAQGLTEFERSQRRYTGREILCDVLWILTGGQFGIEPGYVVMAIATRASHGGGQT